MSNFYKGLPVWSYEGTDQLSTLGAPLMAGFSITLVGVLVALNPPSLVRWQDFAIFFITGAVFLYLACMRQAVTGRALRITQKDAEATWATPAEQAEGLRQYAKTHDRLILVSRELFALGSISLTAGLTVLMVPNHPLSQISVIRLLTIAVAALATLTQGMQTVSRWVGIQVMPLWLMALATPERKLLRTLRENKLLQVEENRQPK